MKLRTREKPTGHPRDPRLSRPARRPWQVGLWVSRKLVVQRFLTESFRNLNSAPWYHFNVELELQKTADCLDTRYLRCGMASSHRYPMMLWMNLQTIFRIIGGKPMGSERSSSRKASRQGARSQCSEKQLADLKKLMIHPRTLLWAFRFFPETLNESISSLVHILPTHCTQNLRRREFCRFAIVVCLRSSGRKLTFSYAFPWQPSELAIETHPFFHRIVIEPHQSNLVIYTSRY